MPSRQYAIRRSYNYVAYVPPVTEIDPDTILVDDDALISSFDEAYNLDADDLFDEWEVDAVAADNAYDADERNHRNCDWSFGIDWSHGTAGYASFLHTERF